MEGFSWSLWARAGRRNSTPASCRRQTSRSQLISFIASLLSVLNRSLRMVLFLFWVALWRSGGGLLYGHGGGMDGINKGW